VRFMIAAIALTMASGAAAAAPAPTDATLGVWLTQTKKGKVEIAPCGASICGKVIWVESERDGVAILDSKNQDPARRNDRIVGSTMLSGFRRSEAGWVGGRIYNAEDGGTYGSELRPQPDGTLKVKGCFGPICRTQIWTRP